MRGRMKALNLSRKALRVLFFVVMLLLLTETDTVHVYAKKINNGWIRSVSGNKTYKRYYENGVMAVGRKKIGDSYYFFKANGILRTGEFDNNRTHYISGDDGRIEAIVYKGNYYYPNGRMMTGEDSYEYQTIRTARGIVASITNSGMSREEKLLTCIRWVQSHPYKMYEGFSRDGTWTARYANHVFNDGGSDCHGDAAAFAYMALAIGYTDVYVCIDSDGNTGLAGGHSWAEINGLVYDPLFAEAKGFDAYYAVGYGTYPLHPITHTAVPYMSESHGGGASLPKDGLVYNKQKKSYYYYNNDKPIKNKWKEVDGCSYYFLNNTRAAQNTCVKIRNKYCLFGEDAKLLKGKKTRIVTLNNKKYRVDKNGRTVPGWSKNGKYYFDKTGKMVTGKVSIKGGKYIFGPDGRYYTKKTSILRTYEKKVQIAKKLKKLKKQKKHK